MDIASAAALSAEDLGGSTEKEGAADGLLLASEEVIIPTSLAPSLLSGGLISSFLPGAQPNKAVLHAQSQQGAAELVGEGGGDPPTAKAGGPEEVVAPTSLVNARPSLVRSPLSKSSSVESAASSTSALGEHHQCASIEDGPVHFSMNPDDYQVGNAIGFGSSAVVYKTLYLPTQRVVALKMIDLDNFERNQIDELRREIQVMTLCRHPNLLAVHASFVAQAKLWIVTPFMWAGSCLDMMRCAFREGLEEPAIATILVQALLGLQYLHRNGHIHRDVKCGNLLMDGDGSVQLADFGVSSSLVEDGGERKGVRNTFVGTPCWMAPEVMEMTSSGYDSKADIWSFGITALELANGHAPFAKYPPMKVIHMTLTSDPPTLDRKRAKYKYSRAFKEMIELCLQRDPARRPTAELLLKHAFFRGAKKKAYLVAGIIAHLTPIEERSRVPPPTRERANEEAQEQQQHSLPHGDEADRDGKREEGHNGSPHSQDRMGGGSLFCGNDSADGGWDFGDCCEESDETKASPSALDATRDGGRRPAIGTPDSIALPLSGDSLSAQSSSSSHSKPPSHRPSNSRFVVESQSSHSSSASLQTPPLASPSSIEGPNDDAKGGPGEAGNVEGGGAPLQQSRPLDQLEVVPGATTSSESCPQGGSFADDEEVRDSCDRPSFIFAATLGSEMHAVVDEKSIRKGRFSVLESADAMNEDAGSSSPASLVGEESAAPAHGVPAKGRMALFSESVAPERSDAEGEEEEGEGCTNGRASRFMVTAKDLSSDANSLQPQQPSSTASTSSSASGATTNLSRFQISENADAPPSAVILPIARGYGEERDAAGQDGILPSALSSAPATSKGNSMASTQAHAAPQMPHSSHTPISRPHSTSRGDVSSSHGARGWPAGMQEALSTDAVEWAPAAAYGEEYDQPMHHHEPHPQHAFAGEYTFDRREGRSQYHCHGHHHHHHQRSEPFYDHYDEDLPYYVNDGGRTSQTAMKDGSALPRATSAYHHGPHHQRQGSFAVGLTRRPPVLYGGGPAMHHHPPGDCHDGSEMVAVHVHQLDQLLLLNDLMRQQLTDLYTTRSHHPSQGGGACGALSVSLSPQDTVSGHYGHYYGAPPFSATMSAVAPSDGVPLRGSGEQAARLAPPMGAPLGGRRAYSVLPDRATALGKHGEYYTQRHQRRMSYFESGRPAHAPCRGDVYQRPPPTAAASVGRGGDGEEQQQQQHDEEENGHPLAGQLNALQDHLERLQVENDHLRSAASGASSRVGRDGG